MFGHQGKYALGSEHEGHAPTIIHIPLLGLLLDLVEKLKESEVQPDPKVTLKQSTKVG
jgi:hypothetical protein